MATFHFSFVSTTLLAILYSFTALPLSYATVVPATSPKSLREYYTRAHSLGDNYDFSSSAWHSVNASDLGYKYDGSAVNHISKRIPKSKSLIDADTDGVLSLSGLGGAVSHLVNDVWNALKGIGKPTDVKITWYTGHDLLNPSCWPNTKWAPTVSDLTFVMICSSQLNLQDESFACALTLEGWTNRPDCLKFLECTWAASRTLGMHNSPKRLCSVQWTEEVHIRSSRR